MLDIRSLRSGDAVDEALAVRDKRGVAPYQGGHSYTLVLGNRSGEILAKVWAGREEAAVRAQYEALAVGNVVHVRAKVTEYRGALELSIEDAPEAVPDGVASPHEFLPSSTKDVKALAREVLAKARRIQEPHLRALVLAFWEDPKLQPVLVEMPAAKSHHHNWLGGFVEHIHGALALADVLADTYPDLDRDLLVAGVLLHDIGKTREYAYGVAIDFTDDGRLLGHIPMGDEMVRDAIARVPGFPPELARRVRHLILSHHGKMEWGSAVEPRTPEAFVLHHIENLDAQVAKFVVACRAHREAGELETWSRPLNQFVYLK